MAGERQDLQNALTHEIGHFIGLDHTCALNGIYPLDKNNKPIVPLDNLGQPVPSCDDVSYPEPDMNLRPTMYPSANPGDMEKRTLSDDDRAGLCAIYPVGTNPASCGGSSGDGCSIATTADDPETSGLEHGCVARSRGGWSSDATGGRDVTRRLQPGAYGCGPFRS